MMTDVGVKMAIGLHRTKSLSPTRMLSAVTRRVSEGAVQTDTGGLFHVQEAATGNACRPWLDIDWVNDEYCRLG